ncbi:MAG: bifunctional 4-hydroxy-2-oxoglutarate aldolase/2-dehydro-3-deoxy-phosphogluconate aldolase [Candidatus Acidiferrales bacterium]
MTMEDVLRQIGKIGIVPVVRAASLEEANRAVEAICAGGIPVVEITMTVPNAIAVIREVLRQYGNQVLTGAGTVLTGERAEECLDAGAEFVVSPGFSLPVLRAAKDRGKLCIPGALTPTEVMAVRSEGAEAVKIFPCGNVGGPKYIKALKAPFPEIKMIPTGGVNLSNATDYIAAGAFALGVGADLVDVAAIRNGNSRKIVDVARKLVEAVRQARQAGASEAKRPVPAAG